MATSIEAACAGHGFAYLPEHRIRGQLEAGLLKPLPASIGGERYAELYLVHADPDRAGPAALRLATLLRETVARECAETEPAPSPGAAARRRRKA
jgi:DNA-binding transcriptional LysR family regulator